MASTVRRLTARPAVSLGMVHYEATAPTADRRVEGGSVHGTALGPSAPLAKAYLFAERPIEVWGASSRNLI